MKAMHYLTCHCIRLANKKLCVFAALMTMTTCQVKVKPESNYLPDNFDDVFIMKDWYAIGPFTFDTLSQQPEYTFANKDLDPYNIHENKITINKIRKAIKSGIHVGTIEASTPSIDFIDYVEKKRIHNKSNFYLYSEIYSKTKREVVFMTNGASSYKLWVNGIEVITATNIRGTIKVANRFIKVALNRGQNTICAKVNRGTNVKAWKLYLGITSVEKAKEIFSMNYYGDFIYNPINPTDSLKVYCGPFDKGKLQIIRNDSLILKTDITPESIHKGYYTVNITSLEEDMYTCSMQFENNHSREAFLTRPYLDYIESLKSQSLNIETDDIIANDLKSYFDRIEFLIGKTFDERFIAENLHYDKNRVYYASILHEYLNTHISHNTKENNSYIAGTYLKSYNTYNGLKSFVFHVGGKALEKGEIPLIITIPYRLWTKSFLVDHYLSRLDQMEIDMQMADQAGIAIAWIHGCGGDYSLENIIHEIHSVIDRLELEYKIDDSKIFLFGDSEGSRRAFLIAEREPELFAGIMAYNTPFTTTNTYDPKDYIPNLFNIPIFMQFGIHDKSASFQLSMEFLQQAKEYGINPTCRIVEFGHMCFSKGYHYYGFQFLDSLANLKEIPYPSTVKYRTLNSASNNAYWLKNIEPVSDSTSETTANYDSVNQAFSISSWNVKSFSIDLKNIGLTSYDKIQVNVNGKSADFRYNIDGNIKVEIPFNSVNTRFK